MECGAGARYPAKSDSQSSDGFSAPSVAPAFRAPNALHKADESLMNAEDRLGGKVGKKTVAQNSRDAAQEAEDALTHYPGNGGRTRSQLRAAADERGRQAAEQAAQAESEAERSRTESESARITAEQALRTAAQHSR
jgi:hypothetical protein